MTLMCKSSGQKGFLSIFHTETSIFKPCFDFPISSNGPNKTVSTGAGTVQRRDYAVGD